MSVMMTVVTLTMMAVWWEWSESKFLRSSSRSSRYLRMRCTGLMSCELRGRE